MLRGLEDVIGRDDNGRKNAVYKWEKEKYCISILVEMYFGA